MPDAKESDQILAAGAPVTFRDGRVVHVRFGMRGLKQLEDEFGSTEAINVQVRAISDAKQKSFHAISSLLAAGLLDASITSEEVDEQIDLRRLPEYALAIDKAITEAFGEPQERSSGKARAKQNGKASRGVPGTTSPPSPMVATTPPSGA